MMTKHNPWSEDRLAELLRAAQRAAIPPDEHFLARLREESTEIFQNAASDTGAMPTLDVGMKASLHRESHAHDERGHVTEQTQANRTPHSIRKSPMFILAGRVLAATAAAVVAAAAWFIAANSGDNAVTLDSVLEKVEKADSLHLNIMQADQRSKTAEAWIDRAKSLRVNRPDGTYEIARGEKLWKIDEKANRAASGPSPYYRPETKSLDLVPLLNANGEISPKMRKNLRAVAVRPVLEKIDGKEYDVYRYQTADDGNTVLVEARVDAATQLLHSLETLADRDGRRTPVCSLTVLNVNQPVDENLFVVGDALTEDGRIGKVTDVQGMVSIKPVMAERWTPVCGNILLKPGDWLQTDPRGANAVAARLAGKSQIAAGPGTLVELSTPRQIRLFSGEIKIAVDKAASAEEGRVVPLTLLGPGEEKMDVKETGVYRVEKEKLILLKQEPKWLKGFEGSEVLESLGSLVANVDGRNEPLTVGYHKVSVEIRDQIARTTVEESFANHTDRRLEGVFYFPLQQDASISGFGMWIGNELVEADIVEKQRAREIYEEILREKRDPGLLEWAGGNLFKARVFPIEPHAEKRIRIVYTQVLPLVGNTFRYSYTLQSEMLKLHPLSELSIDVKLNSAVPLKSVASPTHTVRSDRTEHSAHVEFAAKEYTPNRDFEVVAELDGQQSEITLIPHRRGDDGFFMLLLAPPAPTMQDDRDLLVGKEPLDLLILADTSASLDEEQRARQAEFIAAVLNSLAPRDTFNLACIDVDCDWAFEKAAAAEAKNIDAARQFLDRRTALGWTDLEKAFQNALERAGKNTRIIYVGDGIPTTGDGDPAAVSARIGRMYDDKYRGKNIVCHSVSVGSTFESGVLKAIASLGGGSMRQITGERGPQAVAFDLLKEITRPALSDLKVQFGGLRVARVYPEQLPNLPAGSQQILLGRYLPEGAEQSGEVLVTGRQGDREVRFEKTLSLKNAEEGNSFIPRLWARMHLDQLLRQGATSAIKDDIIALSEEYHIITPYTSLLVLESDADRERFKVKRGFQMRDGEKFFAEGREKADFELVQQQMKRAGGWRLGLRNSVLRQLAGLGRDANVIPQERIYPVADLVVPLSKNLNWSYGEADGKGFSFFTGVNRGNQLYETRRKLGESQDFDSLTRLITSTVRPETWDEDGAQEKYPTFSTVTETETVSLGRATHSLQMLGMPVIEYPEEGQLLSLNAGDRYAGEGDLGIAHLGASTVRGFQTLGRSYDRSRSSFGDYAGKFEVGNRLAKPVWERYSSGLRRNGNLLDALFGTLPPAAAAKKPPEKETDWPEEIRAISKNLLRKAQFALADGGLQIDVQSDGFDPRFGNLTHKSNATFLANANSWLVRSASDGGQTTVQWCDGRERGVFNRSFQLGRLRQAVEQDLARPPIGLPGFVLDSLEDSYRNQKVSLERTGDGQVTLTFKYPGDEKNETLVRIDVERSVVLSIESRHTGKTTGKQQFGDFVDVAGAWWAGKIESRDEKGRLVGMSKQTIVRLDNGNYVQNTNREHSGREQIQFLRDPGKKLIDAKKALKADKADFDDRIALFMQFAQSQQWARAMEQLAAAEKLAEGKAGLRWLRYAALKSARRNEELKKHFLQESATLAKAKISPLPMGEGPGVRANVSDELYLANYLLDQSAGVLENNERLTLLDALESVFARQPEHQLATKHWMRQRAECLANCDRADEALSLYKELAETHSRDIAAQAQYLQNLQSRQEFEAVRKWADRALASDVPWESNEIAQLRGAYAESLRTQDRYEELTGYLARWIEKNPESADPYTQYLDAIYYTDRGDEVPAIVGKWFAEGRRDALASAAAARLQAAMEWILNRGHDVDRYGNYRIDERWQKQLVDTALFYVRHKTQYSIAQQIIDHWRFQQTAGGLQLRKELAKIFAGNFDRLGVEEIDRFAGWLRGNDTIVKKVEWKTYARRLQECAAAEADAERKYRLLQAARNILSFSAEPEEYLAFVRQLAADAPKKYRPECISLLFQLLLNQQWSEKYENEAFDLLGKLYGDQPPERQNFERAKSLHQLTDRMLQGRLEAKNKAIEHPEKLARTELATKRAENLRKTREEFADRLAREEAKYADSLATWIAAERLYLDLLLDRHLEKAAEICWKTLDVEPPKIDKTSDEAAYLRAELDYALRNRYLVTVLNLAARKTAAPALVRRLMDFLDLNIARELAEQTENQQWKLLKFELLVALDRPRDLEAALNDWIRAGDADNRWRAALGYVLAERGKLAEAIATFEAVAAGDELGPDQYRMLSDWYLAVGRRAEYEKSLRQTYKTMNEGLIDQWLNAQIQPWTDGQGPLPSALKPEILWAFQALLEKSSNPSQYVQNRLHPLYRACRDFRLLACLADSTSGHTAGEIYPFLQASRAVIGEIREEAAVDSLAERIAELRTRAATDVDRRALDLLESLTARRAAELRNQPGPHVEKSLAALKRAFERQWSPGEEKLMADFLAGLGVIPQEKLAAEQLRQLESFYAASKPDAQQRLDMARTWAGALWNYKRRQAALDLLAAEIEHYSAAFKERAREGTGEKSRLKPLCEQPIFNDYISYLSQAGQYTQAVEILRVQLEREMKARNVYELKARIFEIHLQALREKGPVAGLRGEALYRTLHEKILVELPSGDAAFDARLITMLGSVYQDAHDRKIAAAAADLKSFAFGKALVLLRRHVRQYKSLANDLCERVRRLCGPAEGIAFLLECRDRQPKWRQAGQSFWNNYGNRLTDWRKEAQDLDAKLSDRLLQLLLAHLCDELRFRRVDNLPICFKNCPAVFWTEHEADFYRAAEEIYTQNKRNGRIICNVADYLAQGLDRFGRAIEILLSAQAEKLLDEGGQFKLVNYLQNQGRYGESIALLQSLVESRPDNLEYRAKLITAFFHTRRKTDLFESLQKTEDYLRKHDRWNEEAIAAVAESCLQQEYSAGDLRRELCKRALKYYEVLIPMHERNQPRRDAADEQLSRYYANRAKCYKTLNETPAAVEAAFGAVVCWGPDSRKRAEALNTLQDVLRDCDDLEAYLSKLDEQTAKTGLENPLVRKTLGQVYSERGQYEKAVAQLRLACDLQPNDAEIHRALVDCCDKQNDKHGAICQLLASLRRSRRDINLYQELGRRLAELHEERESKRAYASIVEVLASEAESHAMLAEIRESQNRWAEAIVEWRQVARLRALEPTGLLKLAAAQIHEKQWADAADTVRQLRAKSWPPRFENVERQIQELERKIKREP
ncbi:MAG: tetratricopeptide repeat protein [Pirellulales bacterium]|nr:tetratricopeptide repeat protein [Pirellulales bacterium]